MKYWIYMHMWTNPSSSRNNDASDVRAFAGSILELYQFVAEQPERWVLTSAHEITATEYAEYTGKPAPAEAGHGKDGAE